MALNMSKYIYLVSRQEEMSCQTFNSKPMMINSNNNPFVKKSQLDHTSLSLKGIKYNYKFNNRAKV